jgi:NAD(P)-dependent dehydrogenase (short-subunit alcohol dehydrogenase family)
MTVQTEAGERTSVYATDALAGVAALVTGASRGIGEASARALAAAGAHVALSGRDVDRLNEVSGAMRDPVILRCDLTEVGAAAKLAADAEAALGQIDVLVNCAGVATPEGDGVAKLDDEAYLDQIVAVNLRGTYALTRIVAKGMASRRSGSIVNISSVAAALGISSAAAYAGTKGALDAITKTMALQYGPAGVRVNSVLPGYIDTEFSKGAGAIPGFEDGVARQTALRRIGHAADIADVVVFLASDAARYVTGQLIHVDGGFTSTKELFRPAT